MSNTLARAVSILGHPFFLVPLTLAVVTRNWVWTAAVVATSTLPVLAVILRNVRRGTWSDVDVSRQEQRSGLYYVGIPLLLLCGAVLYFLNAPPEMLRGVAAAAGMFALGLLGNRFLKISLHMMLAAFCAAIVVREYPHALYAVIPAVAAIAWSRRKLNRHTPAEIAVGLAIGLAGGLVAVF